MPRAGGDYFYIMRGFGPLLGTIAGFSSWFSLSLKGAFALIGMAAYLGAIVHLPLNIISSLLCLFFIFLNLMGIKEAGRFQVFSVLALIGILLAYISWGIPAVSPANFSPFFPRGAGSVFSTASFVFISYGGLTKIAALAEEVKNPGKNLPISLFLSLSISGLLYTAVVYVTVGVLPAEVLQTTLTPISEGASSFGGNALRILVSIGALLAFISTANAAIMTASRYPLGMSRDKLLPFYLQRTNRAIGTPYISILFTGMFMLSVILFFRLELLVKVASSILILLYTFANLSLILFRESKLSSYKPKFCSPFYPYMQILGILIGIFLLIEMGTFIVFLTVIFLFLGFGWYKVYVHKRVNRDSALIYMLERLIKRDKELTSDNLLVELREVVRERDEIVKDKFHHLIEQAIILDIEEQIDINEFFQRISNILAEQINQEPALLVEKFIERERQSPTVIRKGLAIPHIIVEGKNIFKIMLIRAKGGVIFFNGEVVHIIFLLVGSPDERNLHLKVLAAIAYITQSVKFDERWNKAESKEELRDFLLSIERRSF
ncbi:MAG: hypothetical protein B6D56_04765 [Candidatus Omnitrophica bacterium 4484_70.1]|nr:MAG: hypothetical protein B6D56_04765 [Candidatus Omnitrophica bacterium 4484_70.1]